MIMQIYQLDLSCVVVCPVELGSSALRVGVHAILSSIQRARSESDVPYRYAIHF